MAHKGKSYKLWFRRDAAWDLNNYLFGYPECYQLFNYGLMTSARYAVSQMRKVDAVNLSKDYDRTWTSPPYGGFFDNAYWFIRISSPPDERVDKIRFSIWHDAVIPTPLFSATMFVQFVRPQYFGWYLFGIDQLHFLSPDVQVNLTSFFVDLQAATYTRYNP